MKSSTIDGILYGVIGGSTALSAAINTDSAYQYADPILIFWLRTGASTLLATAVTLKSYRSMAFANGQSPPPPTVTTPGPVVTATLTPPKP